MCYIGVLSNFCEIHGPSLIMATVISNENVESLLGIIAKELNDDPSGSCEYCKSFNGKLYPCLVTVEHNISYLSSRCGGGLYDTKALRHACMRCLSCESGTQFVVCDNLLNGGVVCQNFRLPDEKARGGSRLYSLSVMAIGSSKTSVLSSNITRVIFPRFEHIIKELGERNEISIVTGEKQKALTFLHLSMVQLLSLLCHESEEFVKFSTVSLQKITEKPDLTSVKLWAESDSFSDLLNSYLTSSKTLVIKSPDTRIRKDIKAFLQYISLPLIRTDMDFVHEGHFDYEISNDSVSPGQVVTKYQTISYRIVEKP